MSSDKVKNNRPDEFDLILTLVIVGGLMVLLLLFWATLGPTWQDRQLQQGLISQELYESQVKLHTRIAEGLSAILPSVSGLALSGTALAAIGNFRVAEANRKISEETRRIAEEKQITDLFVKAIEMLGDERLEVRIGGIYALERIARNSDGDHWTVMEVLTTFVQKKCSGEALFEVLTEAQENVTEARPELVPVDVEAALRVIGRRDIAKDPSDGRALSLVKASFNGVSLARANFQWADLMGASFYMASIASGIFKNARLGRADLRACTLMFADFTDAELEAANLYQANLLGTNLTGANLKYADLREALITPEQLVTARNWRLAKYDEIMKLMLAAYDPEFAKQLGLATQDNQDQSASPENPPDTFS